MAIPVIMPKQGQSVETCIITQWLKKPGDKVSAGDILFSYETDKAAFDLEAPSDGILLEVFYGEGAEVPVLMNVAVIGQPGESTASFKQDSGQFSLKDEPATKPVPEQAAKQNIEEPALSIPETDSKIRISPRARRLAENKHINYTYIAGSGPNGRIIISDIEKALTDTAPTVTTKVQPGTEFTEQPLSNVRKLIARAMHSSLQNSAQLTHHMSADVRKLLEARYRIKEDLSTGTGKPDITLNDMVCWCVIRALKKFPEANSHFLGDTIRTFNKVHLAIAVDTSRGLMVPAIKNADEMSLQELSRELRQVADACRKGNINPELIQSTAASFTVSNLGSYGVEMFTPVINLPQVAILGICTIINRPADLGNNTFGFVPYIGLSLTYDHRAIDGGPATLFLKEIKKQIENFSYLST
jgi:pyruvate dehydrogenase E2 component (dihydrolipoamide acetyltransferase)